MYSGHKQCHGIKFQGVVAPDGMFVSLFGPIEGSRHNLYMLLESGLLPKLVAMFPENTNQFTLFGDPAYPQSAQIIGGFCYAVAGSEEARWNTAMSKVRQCVEWGFNEVLKQWKFLNHLPSMKVFELPLGHYYFVGCFLTNLLTCLYGNQTTRHFNTRAPSVEEYLELID